MSSSISRREFLKRGALLGSAAAVLPSLLVRAVHASPGGSAKNLILIDLGGGNDGLNTLVPYGLDGSTYYSEFRPVLNVPFGQVLDLGGGLGLNPGLAELKGHFDAGRVAIIPGIGYPNPDFSHEVSEEIWATGDPSRALKTGWLARMLNQFPEPSFPCALDVRSSTSTLFAGSDGFVPAFYGISNFKFPYDSQHWSDKDNRRKAFEDAVNASLASGGGVGTMSDVAVEMLGLIDTLQSVPDFTHVGTYPSHWFATQMKLVARLLNANLGMQIFHLTHGGFDTHSDQELGGYHTGRLQILSQAIDALYADLASIGKAADTLFVVYSEFGRTVYENGSLGTDHGTVNVAFVIGDAVNGGVVGSHPSMDPGNLDSHEELMRTHDLRDLFGTVASKWYAANAGGLFPGYAFTDLGILP